MTANATSIDANAGSRGTSMALLTSSLVSTIWRANDCKHKHNIFEGKRRRSSFSDELLMKVDASFRTLYTLVYTLLHGLFGFWRAVVLLLLC